MNITNNEEAILVYGLGDQSAFLSILTNFQFLIKKISGEVFQRSPFKDFIDFDELIYAGQMGLKQAVETYNFCDAPFAPYAKTVIERAINAVSRALDGPTMKMMNNASSLDDYIGDDEDGLRLSDIVGVDDVYTAHEFSTEMIGNLEDFYGFDLDELEQEVLAAKFLGYSNSEIIENFHISRRQLQNALTNIRFKHDMYMDEESDSMTLK